jgi:AraC-like DNA-binding protein
MAFDSRELRDGPIAQKYGSHGRAAGMMSGFGSRMLPEVRMTRVIDAIGLHRKKRLSCAEAGALLGMSERHFRRLRDAYHYSQLAPVVRHYG